MVRGLGWGVPAPAGPDAGFAPSAPMYPAVVPDAGDEQCGWTCSIGSHIGGIGESIVDIGGNIGSHLPQFDFNMPDTPHPVGVLFNLPEYWSDFKQGVEVA